MPPFIRKTPDSDYGNPANEPADVFARLASIAGREPG